MKTETRSHDTIVSTDVEHALEWLKTEHPHGVDLVYVDYRDSLDENKEMLMEVIKDNYSEKLDEAYLDSQHEGVQYVIDEYKKEIAKDGIDDIDDDVLDAMKEWLWYHDTSNYTEQLLKNTGNQLFFIETQDESEDNQGNVKELIRKYGGKNEKRIHEINTVTREQFYPAPVQFYFWADPADVRKALHSNDTYVLINGAFFGTVDRIQGSNWLGEDACFQLHIPRDELAKQIHLDDEPGTGYGWMHIAGRTYSREEEAGITTTNKKRVKGYKSLAPVSNPALEREKELAEHYKKTGKCTFGDMNYSRHKNTSYRNDFPCGQKCADCGTFWID